MPQGESTTTDAEKPRSAIRDWLSLVRLPNLLTLPGDAALGYLIAERAVDGRLNILLGFDLAKGRFETMSFLWVAASLLCLYVFGLVDNDLADAKLDAEERPERPIPSGAISRKAAGTAAAALLTLGLAAAIPTQKPTLHAAILLAVLIFAYNHHTKHDRLLGPLNMALCRVLSLTLGLLAAGGKDLLRYEPAFLAAAAVWLLYFMSLTMAATNENKSGRAEGRHTLLLVPFLWLSIAPFSTGALAVLAKVGEVPPSIFLGFAASIIFLLISIRNFFSLNNPDAPPKRKRAAIGEMVRSVILLQSAGTAFLGYPYVALALLMLWPLATAISTRFASS